MKYLPKITTNIEQTIKRWVIDSKDVKPNDIELFIELYDLLEMSGHVKHNPKAKFYRGLNVSYDGMEKFINTGTVDLKRRKLESWSCDIHMAGEFVPEEGVILERSIPRNKVLMNLEHVLQAYSNKKNWPIENSTGQNQPIKRLIKVLEMFDECELITSTICTKCTIKDMVEITVFKLNMMGDNRQPLIDLLKSLKHGKTVDNVISDLTNSSFDDYKDKYWIFTKENGTWEFEETNKF